MQTWSSSPRLRRMRSTALQFQVFGEPWTSCAPCQSACVPGRCEHAVFAVSIQSQVLQALVLPQVLHTQDQFAFLSAWLFASVASMRTLGACTDLNVSGSGRLEHADPSASCRDWQQLPHAPLVSHWLRLAATSRPLSGIRWLDRCFSEPKSRWHDGRPACKQRICSAYPTSGTWAVEPAR
jgi:hypothetical protein